MIYSLLGLLVHGMLSAESAVFLGLDPLRMSLLVLRRVVIALLAFRAGQCDPRTHSLLTSAPGHFHLQAIFRAKKIDLRQSKHNLSQKMTGVKTNLTELSQVLISLRRCM
jgi:hypothetical protein